MMEVVMEDLLNGKRKVFNSENQSEFKGERLCGQLNVTGIKS